MFSSSVDGKVIESDGFYRNQMWDNKKMIAPFISKGSEMEKRNKKFLPGYPNCGPCTEVHNL